jgi:ABC-type nitrate/sulfonate/bicarbonate transport system substrate-binding protein
MIGLKIGGVPEHFNLPWRLAIEEGKFKDLNLDLHWSDMGGGTGQMIRGLETGSIDLAVILTEGITKAILQGLDAKILDFYVDSPLIWGIHVPYNSSITQVRHLEGKPFAISREGSGSHLMTYVLAEKLGWTPEQLEFNVVGDVYGGLWALANEKAYGFLWEKYTTQPYVNQKKCTCIDTIITPWPCFVVAVRSEVARKYEKVLSTMMKIVQERAWQLKNGQETPQIVAWRYNLALDQVADWLKRTDWNYEQKNVKENLELVKNYLLKLKLIDEKQAINWHQKLIELSYNNKKNN